MLVLGALALRHATYRRAHAGSDPSDLIRARDRAECHRFSSRGDGKHPRDLRRDDRGDGAALDEGAKRDGWLADGGVFDAALFDEHQKTARYRQGPPRWPQQRDSATDRAFAPCRRRSGKTWAADDVGGLRRFTGRWRNADCGDYRRESCGVDRVPEV